MVDIVYIWIVIIAVLVWLLAGGEKSFSFSKRKESMEILDDRLAKGEIDLVNYQEIKKILEESKK